MYAESSSMRYTFRYDHHRGTMLNFAPNLPVRLGSFALFRKASRRPSTRHRVYLCSSVVPTAMSTRLQEAASSQNLASNQVDSFLHLTKLLLDENAKYNLTAIRKRDDVIEKHVVDALTLLPTLNAESPSKLIDVGTGAGFPGLVLAIARPAWQLTLLDSVRKKTVFHEVVVRELGLKNVKSVWARAEDAGQKLCFREQFCVALARSVAELRVLAELTLPFVRVGGCVIAQKSVDKEQREIKDAAESLKICGGELEAVNYARPPGRYDVIGTQVEEDTRERKKTILVVRKSVVTPRRFPRKPGVPRKSPL